MTAAAFVYIVYALDDAAEVAEIADAIRDAGWAVCFGHLDAPGLHDASSNERRLSEAACVLAVWSANTANSSVLRSDALEAAQQKKLVLVTLDDASSPDPGWIRIELQGWFDGTDPDAVAPMFSAIAQHAGPRSKGRGRIVPYPVRGQHRVAWSTVGAAALVVACLAMIPVLLFSQNPTGGLALNSPVARDAASGAASDEALAAMSRWAQIPHGDLPAIRGFMRQYSGTRAAEEARRQIEKLEEFAWRGILQQDDLPTQLEALTNFRIDFPDGNYAFEAMELENRRSEALEGLRVDLVSLGFIPFTDRNDIATTRKGVEAFERSIGQMPSGRITETLSSSLAVVVESKGGAR